MTRALSYRITASDACMRTAIGTRHDGVIHINQQDSGTALYGPYVPLPAGTYRATLRFRRDAPFYGSAMMDVCAESGTRILESKAIHAAQIAEAGMEVSVDFSCANPLGDLEVRLLSEGDFAADIEGLEIAGELKDAVPRVEILDLPQVPIRNIVSHGRNLYEGYQRGVGLQFADLARKIGNDPDFREARDLAGNRTIVSDFNLCNIFLVFKFQLPRLVAGHIVEFGSYKGGSAIFMAALATKFLPGRRVYGFDTFAGMPPTDSRVDHHQIGAFSGVDLAELRRYVDGTGLPNLEFVQGDFADTAAPTLQRIGPVAFCHLDCDIRSGIECAYDTTKPHMVSGGYWVFDDPLVSDCLGAAEAMEDLLIRRDQLNSEQVFPHYVFRQP